FELILRLIHILESFDSLNFLFEIFTPRRKKLHRANAKNRLAYEEDIGAYNKRFNVGGDFNKSKSVVNDDYDDEEVMELRNLILI
ncbi:hypothetical protein S83_034391, partial [Arachis hypogaea]